MSAATKDRKTKRGSEILALSTLPQTDAMPTSEPSPPDTWPPPQSATSEAQAPSPAPEADAATTEVEELLQKARVAQQERRWLDAATAYRAVLDQNSKRAPIWVQFGHMLKEGGKTDDAAAAYQAALDLEPTNADTHLQFGHLYKITNKKQRAIQMYSRALELDPALRDAAVELERLGAKSRAEFITRQSRRPHPGKFVLFFDITDLMLFFNSNRTPTGIQRITLAIIEAALASEQAKHIELCMLEIATGAWKTVDSDDFLLLVALSREGAKNSDPIWRTAVEGAFKSIASAAALIFPEQSVIVNLGSPWGIANYFMAVRDAKRRNDILYVAFVHDTIPLLLPELCDGPTSSTYTRWMAGLGLHADLILANAENTRRDLMRAIRRFGGWVPPCRVVQPNGDFSLFFRGQEPVSDEVQALADCKYALFVGTIEPRKNHQFVLSAWRKLITEFGANQVPTLVLAGKLGWHCEPVAEFLRCTDGLNGKVKVLHEVSDVDLQALYRNAQFTIYNSHYEGWGLPVTESLSFHKVPVVSKNSALIESGGRHAIFYESNSEPSFLEVIRAIIANPQSLDAREEEIRSAPPVRPWDEIFLQLHEAVARLTVARAAESLAELRSLERGRIYSFGVETALRNPGDFALAEAARVGSGWHAIEDWGTWTAKPVFELSLNVASAKPSKPPSQRDGDGSLLYLHVRAQNSARLRLEISGIAPQTFVVPGGREVVLKAKIDPERLEAGPLRVLASQNTMVKLGEITDGKDGRIVGIGLRAFMLCDEDDTAARVRLIEEISMGYVLPVADITRAERQDSGDDVGASGALIDRSAAA